MINLNMNVKGAAELDAALLRLGLVGERVIKGAVAKGANVLLKEARKNARVEIGGDMGMLISKHLISRVWRKKRLHIWARNIRVNKKGNDVFVYQAKKSKYPDGRTYIPSAIEYGHVAQNGRVIPAKPFMRTAFSSKRLSAYNTTTREMWRGIKMDFER